MAKSRRNPFAFTPLPVTLLTTIVFCAVLISVLVVHHIVPPAPDASVPLAGINLTEAWLDLKFLSNGYHPYNSRRNDVVRNWLLQRIDEVLIENNSSYAICDGSSFTDPSYDKADVVVFNDLRSNLSFAANLFGSTGISHSFEGTNIIVYIRGSEDGEHDWRSSQGRGGVLVNAHYDSVTTGFGATDDGVGVISVLQLIKYFSRPEHRPKRGVVALLNNAEEDFLLGAWAFSQHPISSFPHAFVNLEGAGAGGKATLFRSTDYEVTGFYKGTRYPYGTVVSADGFKRRFVRSQTDYAIFYGSLGMRGLDIAFFEPRARYHTDQDDTRHTSVDSVWHMLTAALHTVYGLAMDTSTTFEGEAAGKGKVRSGSGSDGVYFDMFGHSFATLQLHTLFALSVTLLVVAPISLFAVSGILSHFDKLYIFSISTHHHEATGDRTVPIGGFRGFFRYPIIFSVASAGTVGCAFLLVKENPFIVYSSPYPVWSMMMSIWLCLAWFLFRAIDFVRPTALHRLYSMLWMFVGGWVLLVIATVYEERSRIGSPYLLVITFAAMFLATFIGFCEQFSLKRKQAFAAEEERPAETTGRSDQATSGDAENDEEEAWAEEASESTSLLGQQKRRTFGKSASPGRAGSGHAEAIQEEEEPAKNEPAYGNEQRWSRCLPSWTWILQLLVLVPVPIIVIAQVGLFIQTALGQTLSDGTSILSVYLFIAVFSILMVAPLGPFIHRFTYHIPLFLFGVFVGTLVYNLIAFPFSGNNRLKVYFTQRVDLDSGINRVALMGVESNYMMDIIRTLPSAAGQSVDIASGSRLGLTDYSWDGLPPKVVPNTMPGVPPLIGYGQWLDYNATRAVDARRAQITIAGKNTRQCKLIFAKSVSTFHVEGSATDSRFPIVSEGGSTEINLRSRDWDKTWNVTFEWDGAEGMDGRVVCQWSDEYGLGLVPALEEIRMFAPDWTVPTTAGTGLVDGSKAFSV